MIETDKEHDCDGGPMGTDEECSHPKECAEPKPCCRGCKKRDEMADPDDT